MFKNVAAKFIVFAFDATTNVPKTGDAANITAYVAKDYGTVTVLGDTSATEMDATNAPGYYLFDAAQGETNADCLLVSGKSSTANVKIVGAPAVIYTRPTTGWLAPTTAGRTLDVSATGEAGLDWGNIGSPTTAVGLSGTTVGTVTTYTGNTVQTGDAYARLGAPAGASVSADIALSATYIDTEVTDIRNRLPAALVGGRMDSSVGAMAANVMTAAAAAADFGAEIADAYLDRNMATGTDSSTDTIRTPRSVLRQIRNKFSISGVTITYTKEDDVTTSHSGTLSVDASAVPITGYDPGGP